MARPLFELYVQIEPTALNGVFRVPVAGMVEVVIRLGLVHATDAVVFGVVAVAAFQFREDVPYPVGLFSPVFDLAHGLRIVPRLCVEETLEVEGICHHQKHFRLNPSHARSDCLLVLRRTIQFSRSKSISAP